MSAWNKSDSGNSSHRKVAPETRGRVSDPFQPLRAAHVTNAPGFAGGWLPSAIAALQFVADDPSGRGRVAPKITPGERRAAAEWPTDRQARSSRLGRRDFGVNRARVEAIRARMQRAAAA
jgi:hypothetical protein